MLKIARKTHNIPAIRCTEKERQQVEADSERAKLLLSDYVRVQLGLEPMRAAVKPGRGS